jgi:hypothetical protein
MLAMNLAQRMGTCTAQCCSKTGCNEWKARKSGNTAKQQKGGHTPGFLPVAAPLGWWWLLEPVNCRDASDSHVFALVYDF